MAKQPSDDSPRPSSWQFYTDQHTPASVCRLFAEGKITASDLLLLWVINSQIQSGRAKNGTGTCWMTNKALAAACQGSCPTYVSERLSHLSLLGLVIVFHCDGRRHLECDWSRTAEERQSLPGEYGRACRDAYDVMTNRLRGFGSDPKPPSGKTEAPLREKPKPPLREKPKQNCMDDLTSKDDREETKKTPPTPPLARGGGSAPEASALGEEPTQTKTNGRRREGERPRLPGRDGTDPEVRTAESLAQRLHALLLKHRKITDEKRPASWTREFGKLLKVRSEGEIAAALDWYDAHVGEEYVPHLFCARTFCKDFARLELAMSREARAREPRKVPLRRVGGTVVGPDGKLPEELRW